MTKIEEITRLQKQIALHSMLYYRFDTNLWTDLQYDAACQELVYNLRTFPEEAALAQHANAYKNFDGTTGYYLTYHNDFAGYAQLAQRILTTHESYSQSQNEV